ncbi:MAG: hypothetical protein CM15mP74_31820 [Halieaceae bacterium]|nr:MAG: hypothetical protein CM15mP74_31820 [Halieaceae bacterium]
MSAVDLIIFGATGDLSARKLFPALFSWMLQSSCRMTCALRQWGGSNKRSKPSG